MTKSPPPPRSSQSPVTPPPTSISTSTCSLAVPSRLENRTATRDSPLPSPLPLLHPNAAAMCAISGRRHHTMPPPRCAMGQDDAAIGLTAIARCRSAARETTTTTGAPPSPTPHTAAHRPRRQRRLRAP
uniref:Uncharacterized protein n=1 Tax=Arundo donax TaxID=35708 RepID=A0A0A8YPU9_ARUDO